MDRPIRIRFAWKLCPRSPLLRPQLRIPAISHPFPGKTSSFLASGIVRESIIRLTPFHAAHLRAIYDRLARSVSVDLLKNLAKNFTCALVCCCATNGREEILYRESIITVYFFFYFGIAAIQPFSTHRTDFCADARSNFLLARRSNGGPTKGEKIPFVSLCCCCDGEMDICIYESIWVYRICRHSYFLLFLALIRPNVIIDLPHRSKLNTLNYKFYLNHE